MSILGYSLIYSLPNGAEDLCFSLTVVCFRKNTFQSEFRVACVHGFVRFFGCAYLIISNYKKNSFLLFYFRITIIGKISHFYSSQPPPFSLSNLYLLLTEYNIFDDSFF